MRGGACFVSTQVPPRPRRPCRRRRCYFLGDAVAVSMAMMPLWCSSLPTPALPLIGRRRAGRAQRSESSFGMSWRQRQQQQHRQGRWRRHNHPAGLSFSPVLVHTPETASTCREGTDAVLPPPEARIVFDDCDDCCGDDDGSRANDPPASAAGGGESSSRGRRTLLKRFLAASATAGMAATAATTAGWAGVPEVDVSGELYSPKIEMLSGGSDAARGMRAAYGGRGGRTLRAGEALQTVYETRFIAYLSRFLLNFDPAAHAWWVQRGVSDSWEERSGSADGDRDALAETVFAEFAESVEVGLADYFVGPYGSYSSLQAAKAGILASESAPSAKPERTERSLPDRLVSRRLLRWRRGDPVASTSPPMDDDDDDPFTSRARQGVLNLYTLLKARYSSVAAKRQLAILFSMISSPRLQPSDEIAALLGEADNATVSAVAIFPSPSAPFGAAAADDDDFFRTSCRRGGGYSVRAFPRVTIDPPPALGDDYRAASASPIMRPTGRVLRIQVLDPGCGYEAGPPQVRVVQGGFRRACQAAAILDRLGRVESVLVLDPGLGYGGRQSGETPPKVIIDPPRIDTKGRGGENADNSRKKTAPAPRRAKAVAYLEYEIVGVQVVEGGNGYVRSEPPTARISPPERDPDWFLDLSEQPEMAAAKSPVPPDDEDSAPMQISARVTEMRQPDGNVAYSVTSSSGGFRSAAAAAAASSTGLESEPPGTEIDDTLLFRLQRDPLEMIPSSIRPRKRFLEENAAAVSGRGGGGGTTQRRRPRGRRLRYYYTIPSLSDIPQTVVNLSPRYRAYDPLFGGIGSIPVQKGASELRAGEYARLALSGAVCTVVVRTLLNPLELIKTKQQLQNDDELLKFAREKNKRQQKRASDDDDDQPSRGEDRALAVTTRSSSPYPNNATLVSDGGGEVALAMAVASGASGAPETRAPAAAAVEEAEEVSVGTLDMMRALVELRGPLALFQSADITFLASLAFGSFGFGATELFRRSFTMAFFVGGSESGGGGDEGSEIVLLLAAALATVVTAAAASPFELLRVRSMGLVVPEKWTNVLRDSLGKATGPEPGSAETAMSATGDDGEGDGDGSKDFDLKDLKPRDVLPLWAGFAPTLSRELPFAIAKFLTFDIIAKAMVVFLNSQSPEGSLPVQVGSGPSGLAVSAAAGALAGIAGAVVSHPADLILTYTSAGASAGVKKKATEATVLSPENDNNTAEDGAITEETATQDWKDVVRELIGREGGLGNLFLGLPARSLFFFLVIGLQFFLYDYVKNFFQVGSDDLNLVLDVFYAVRAGLVAPGQ